MNHYDVVIVGAGSAGCALAARLSENSSRSVLLLEAGADLQGPIDATNELLDASRMVGAAEGHPANWTFAAQVSSGRHTTVPRGKVIGGSSTINGGLFVRATRDDFDGWAAAGNHEWSYEKVLPFLKRLEDDRDFPDSEVHGTSGPIPVVRTPHASLHPTSTAFLSACAGLGFVEEVDKNAPGPPGWGALPLNVVDGVRVNTALAYLAPNRGLPNLTIECGVTARRVLFEATRAIAVEVERAGAMEMVSGDEIVLSAGAVMSAHLLLVSGIGPADALAVHDIPVVADLAGVGTRCADHPQVLLGYSMGGAEPSPSPVAAIAEVALDTVVDGVPVSLMPYVSPMSFLVPGAAGSAAEFSVGVLLERTTPAGRISLTSADPAHRPSIDYHYLETAADQTRIREAVEIGLSIIAAPEMHAAGARRTSPADDRELDEWIAASVDTAVHLCSSAPMGPDSEPAAVVDQYCRVRGVEGLRVVDTSVLPTTPSRGTAATAVLIGERASAFFDGVAS